MQLKNMRGLMENPWVEEHDFLRRFLQGRNDAQKIEEIQNCIIEFSLNMKSRKAIEMIQILWPTIVMSDLNIGKRETDLRKNGKDLKLEGLTDPEQLCLDSALEKYAAFFHSLISRLLNGRNIPIDVIIVAGYELLCATHLMRDTKKAHSCFFMYLTNIVTREFPETIWSQQQRSVHVPAILRDSLRETPMREGRDHHKILLTYLLALELAMEHVDDWPRARIVTGVTEVVLIALCRADVRSAYKMFLELAKSQEAKV